MRRFLLCSTLLLAACGGDKSSGPSEPQFPAVSGIYHVTGGFDGLSQSQASLTGTLSINQPSRDASSINGQLTVTLKTATQSAAVTGPLNQASVSESGDIGFTIQDPSGTWSFSGHVSNGSIGNGRHTLQTADGDTFSGSWQATK